MKAATKKALEKSIQKWEKIVDGTGSDRASDNCSLCQRFMSSDDCQRNDGEKCPVYEATGKKYCDNTPYRDWILALKKRDKHEILCRAKATDDETVMCAVLELEFLKSLRPVKE